MKTFDHDSYLKFLKADFATFRARCRPHARIPDDLRQAILNGIASGLAPSLMTATFGVTTGQIANWRQRMVPKEKVSEPKVYPRILDVDSSTSNAGGANGLRVSYEGGRLLLELSF